MAWSSRFRTDILSECFARRCIAKQIPSAKASCFLILSGAEGMTFKRLGSERHRCLPLPAIPLHRLWLVVSGVFVVIFRVFVVVFGFLRFFGAFGVHRVFDDVLLRDY